MSEVMQFSDGQPAAAYETGDLSTAEGVVVASASGSTSEKHASGSYGNAVEVLGGVVRSVVEM